MKVLIMSHNPITDYNSMGKTLLSLFKSFEESQLCQLYIYPTIPNILKCGSYYRVTDKDVFTNVIFRNKRGRVISNHEISDKNQLYENAKEQKIYHNKATHKEFKLIARKILWTCGNWDTKAFRQWMMEQKPDVIFAAAGLSSFFYDLILKVSEKYNIPIVSYVCDDFYFSSIDLKRGILQKYYYKMLRKKITKLMNCSKAVITICDSLGKAYSKEFGCVTRTVFTGANINISTKPQDAVTKQVLRYFGNLQLNRYHSLYDIGQALMRINKKYNTEYVLEIYTSDLYPDELKNIPTIKCNDFVKSDKMYQLIKKTIMLVHVESFESESIDRVRYSISTKIADGLASGVCMLAYGPKEVASIQHLYENNCAVIANDKKQLEEMLECYLFSEEKRSSIIEKALITAMRFHSPEEQSKCIRKVLSEVAHEDTSS